LGPYGDHRVTIEPRSRFYPLLIKLPTFSAFEKPAKANDPPGVSSSSRRHDTRRQRLRATVHRLSGDQSLYLVGRARGTMAFDLSKMPEDGSNSLSR
jgi:hypothetical protein